MESAGTELRGARRLIIACVAALLAAGIGLVVTVRDVAHWVDAYQAERDRANTLRALEHIASSRPQADRGVLALQFAASYGLAGARVSDTAPAPPLEIGVPLPDGRYFAWTAPRPGLEAAATFFPTRLPLILGAVLVVALMLIRVGKLASALDRERHKAREIARRDPLSDLGNRLAFDEDLERRIALGEAFALACVDLNGFKAVNDRYGHAAGDAVLRGVGVRLRRLAGEGDASYRLGGDEFAMLIRDDGRNLGRFAKKIVLNVDDVYAVGEGREACVGVCVGVALSPQDATSRDALMRLADDALYRAKAASGSCCRFAADAAEEPGRGIGAALTSAA